MLFDDVYILRLCVCLTVLGLGVRTGLERIICMVALETGGESFFTIAGVG